MKSSNDTKERDLKFNPVTFTNLIFNRIGLARYIQANNVDNFLQILNENINFRNFLKQKPGTNEGPPSKENLNNLKIYFNCMIVQDCKALVDAYHENKVSLEELVHHISTVMQNYNEKYREYTGYYTLKEEEILEEIIEYVDYNEIHTGKMQRTGEFHNVPTFYSGSSLYNKPLRQLDQIQHLIIEQNTLIDDINQLIEKYKTSERSSYGLHDKKIYLLQLALQAVLGDYDSLKRVSGTRTSKFTSQELITAMEKFQEGLKGTETKELLDRVISFTTQYAKDEQVIRNTPRAREIREHKLQLDQGERNINTLTQEMIMLSSTIDPKQIRYISGMTDDDLESLGKFNYGQDNKLFFNKKDKTFVKLEKKLNTLQEKYASENSEMHQQKYHVIVALQKFLEAPVEDNNALQALMQAIKENPRCFEGRNSETRNILTEILAFRGINSVSIVPLLKDSELKDVLDDVTLKIDLYAENAIVLFTQVDTASIALSKQHDELIATLEASEKQLNELVKINQDQCKKEIANLSEVYNNTTTIYMASQKIGDYRDELIAQINDTKTTLHQLREPQKLIERLQRIQKKSRYNLEQLVVALQILKSKYDSMESHDITMDKLLAARDEIEKLNGYLLKAIENYRRLTEEISGEYAKIISLKEKVLDLEKITHLDYTSEEAQKIREQARIRETQSLEDKYKEIDERYRQDQSNYNEIMTGLSKELPPNYSEKYNVTQIMSELSEEIDISQQNFNMVFGTLSEIGDSIVGENVEDLDKELDNLLDEESDSDKEFTTLMNEAPNVSDSSIFKKVQREPVETTTNEKTKQEEVGKKKIPEM